MSTIRRIDFQPAYILHTRPYQETSLLLELFTQDFGRFAVIAKGVRRQKNPARALLQAFVPLLISCSGRGELLLLKNYEPAALLHQLSGRRLISGFYLNELLMRLLHRYDAHEDLFQHYANTLRALEQSSLAPKQDSLHALEHKPSEQNSDPKFSEQSILRQFEKNLLSAIGYELQLHRECETGLPIDPDAFYLFDPDRGPIQIVPTQITRIKMEKKIGAHSSRSVSSREGVYSGKSLIALSRENFEDVKVQREVKYLMRQALKHRLGNKPLETRQLFC